MLHHFLRAPLDPLRQVALQNCSVVILIAFLLPGGLEHDLSGSS